VVGVIVAAKEDDETGVGVPGGAGVVDGVVMDVYPEMHASGAPAQ
jgi:hypothetical protein